MTVTYSRKRYVVECLSCKSPFDVVRRDQVTCSSACRVYAHRHKLREKAERDICESACNLRDMQVWRWQQLRAARKILPSFESRIMAGDGNLRLEDLMPEILEAFDSYFTELLNALEDQS